ncbi:MAG: sugar phosphate isomerase/epimerase [Planctomycetota bacterium]|nr:sugar phosphate isomerase/epimerase [Planctomycetota bacterium]
MKFAICNETFQDWPFDKAFAFARECGYRGLEIAPFTMAADAQQIPPTQREEVRRQAEDAGLEVIGLHWLLAKTEGYYLTSPDAAVRRRTAEYLCHLALLCRDLGGSIMVFGSPDQRKLLPDVTLAQANDYAVEVLREAMPVLEDSQVTLALEPLAPAETDFLTTAAEAVAVINRVESPNCRLHLDVKAMAGEPLPVADMIRLNAAHLVHFHANDPNRQGPGFGDVDFVPILRALREINYDGWVSVEVFDYAPGIERLARESIDYMQDCLAKLDNPS